MTGCSRLSNLISEPFAQPSKPSRIRPNLIRRLSTRARGAMHRTHHLARTWSLPRHLPFRAVAARFGSVVGSDRVDESV